MTKASTNTTPYQRLTRPDSCTGGRRNTRVTMIAAMSPVVNDTTVSCPHSSIHRAISQTKNGSWRQS